MGADFSVDKINKMFLMLGEYLSIPRTLNKQVFINANRWTPTSLENQGCVEVVNNEIVGYPSPELTQRTIVVTEMRGVDLCTVVKNIYPRNADQPMLNLSTVDPKRDNIRKVAVKHKTDSPNFSGKCTNCFPPDLKVNEEFKSMLTVIAAMVPGSGAYFPSNATQTGFNSIRCDRNQSRDRLPEEGPRREYLTKLLALAHVLSACLIALPNRSGIVPYEIADPVLAYLDWLFLYIRTHVSCVLDTDVLESFNRMKVLIVFRTYWSASSVFSPHYPATVSRHIGPQVFSGHTTPLLFSGHIGPKTTQTLKHPCEPQEGYESRHVVYTMWKTAMVCISKDIPLMEAAMQAINMMHLNAIALTEEIALASHIHFSLAWHAYRPIDPVWRCWQVPAVAHSFLTRGVHMGALIMTCVVMQDLRIPIIPIDDLCDFFAADQVRTI